MNCKVALVDSGIDVNLYGDKVIRYIEYTEDPCVECEFDSNGHGTLCSSAMLSINPDIQFVVVKVLNENKLCSDERLLKALTLLSDIDINIINLSLSTSSLAFAEEYKQIIAKLTDQGKIIIASTVNGNVNSLLSELKGTIGIYGNLFECPKDFWYQRSNAVQCVANSVPQLLQGKHGQYELFGGNSKATAVFSGIVSLYWNQLKDCSFVEKEIFFEEAALRKSWAVEEICLDPLLYNKHKEKTVPVRDQIYLQVSSVLSEQLKVGLNNITKSKGKPLNELGLTRHNAINIIQAIENEIGIKLNYSYIDIFWFNSIDTLCQNIRKVKYGLSGYE